MKSILTLSFLALMGCSGAEFTSADLTATAGAGSSEAGQTGEAGEGIGGSQGGRPTVAGSDSGGSDVGGTEAGQGGDTPLGGTAGSAGGSDVGGTAGSGMAGSTAGTGGSDVGPDPICTPSEGRCVGSDFEVCSADGTAWTKQETCGSVCTTSGCIGSCKPGTNKCEGKDSMTCDVSGTWKKTATCPFICGGEGECQGSCVPGTASCSGNVPQTCSQDGELLSDTMCPNLCSNGVCTGACTPGQKECNGNKSRTCQANGTWKETTCSFVCQGAGVCGGECVPGESRCTDTVSLQVCSAQGKWETGTSCPFICEAGACAGVCKPGLACADDGNSCTNDICAADAKTCTHPAKSNGTSCGSSTNNECNKPDTCQAGVCQSNFVAAGTSCTTDNNPCSVDACNGSGLCGHAPGNAGTVCRASACTNGQITSEAKCTGTSISCPTSTQSNCLGPCDQNTLMCAAPQPTKMADAYTMLALDSDSQYIYASVRDEGNTTKILRIQKSDNTQTVLYRDISGNNWIYAILLAGDHIYLGETLWNGSTYTGRVTRLNTTGLNVENQIPIFIQNVATFGFAKNGTRVYWSDATQYPCDCDNPPVHHIYSTGINGDGTVTIFSRVFTLDIAPDIEVTDTDLYVWEMTGHTSGSYRPSLNRYGLSNSNNAAGLIAGSFKLNNTDQPTTSAVGDVPALTKNSSTVYANVAFGSGTAIFSVSPSNAVTLLGTDSQAAPTTSFLADNAYVYFSNERVSVTGGSFNYTMAHSIAALTMDGSNLYFASYGYWTALPYSGGVDVPVKAIFKTLK